MLVLPALIFPLVLVLALQKLYQIPKQLWRAELHFCPQRRGWWAMVCGMAYLALLGCTLRLGFVLVHAGWASDEPWSALLAVVGWVAAYPCVYVGAAWVFYHGLKPRPGVVG